MGKVNRGKGKQYGQGGAAFPFMVRDEETAWRTMNCRQATHPIFTCFLGSREEPPGGERCAPRRRVTTNPDSGVLLELPGGDGHPPGDADQLLVRFWCFE
ncbi:hypothetical protein DEO72_LG10g2205 [Vigna unguiculata]|uniref:Uncharacterized protein n=1 Tax=Vigna unguiculata TaxID=3917 RepID=A0A4D6NDJ8_VIGUN|nr:hypothetical protein DEO72_LG10g2205 [Vigna unguiculata]